MEHVKLITGEHDVQTRSAGRPKFSMHGGRTWDSIGDTADGQEIYADTTWGHNGYFERAGRWYSFKLPAF